MKRRHVIAMLGGAAVSVPFAVGAQTTTLKRIGLVMTNEEQDPQGQERIAALRRGLQDLGWSQGRNLHIEVRWSGGDIARIRQYTQEIVKLAPDLIVANGTPVLAAFKQATKSIPIIFVVVNDPVAQGFISSMSRPGGNITGFSFLDYSVVEKSLEFLKQLAPNVIRVGVLFNPDTYPYYDVFLRSFEALGRRLSVDISSIPVRASQEIERVIAEFAQRSGSGLILPPDPFTIVRRGPIITATAQNRLPVICFFRQFVHEGALMSYGADTSEIFRQSATYVDRIFKGAKPADLPAQAPTKFELAINVRAAKALGLTPPPTLLMLADEVIE